MALAALSLLWSHTLTYDPWSWLLWGREIIHGTLSTAGGGTSWKPLPVIVDTVLAPFGGAAPDLWLILARTGALMALVLAFWLGQRVAGALAGGLAVAWIVLGSHVGFAFGWYGFYAAGWSEGMLTAFALAAFAAHLGGRPRGVLLAWFAVALIRPEAAAFIVLYAALTGRRDRALWVWAAGLVIAAAVLWIAPDYLGSGHLLAGSSRALDEVPPSIRHSNDPGLRDVALMRDLIALPVLAGVVAALLLARDQTRRLVAVMLGVAVGWLAVIAIMTQAGYPGVPRFFFAPIAVLCVVAGIGWGDLSRRVPGRVPRLAVGALIVAVNVVFLAGHLGDLRHQRQAAVYEASLNGELGTAVQRLGGAGSIRRCGAVATTPLEVPVLKWDLGLGARVADRAVATGTVFQATVFAQHVRLPRLHHDDGLRLALAFGRWRVYQRCRPRSVL
ncbi:MAG TPA: hypothetical protein VFN55_18285 [Solirubrobacteraceae bacterium]|nr:hypothetical protein [Solirubrobacteraceae bacterium]